MKPRPLCLGLPKLLGVVSAQLQEAFGTELDAYVSRVRLADRPTTAKVINDPVWRTVRVEGWELPVIDSPIFQRLRHIHQLGLAGLVFPGANYSRFEHSIGVLHQVQRLIEAINRNARAYADRRRVPPVIRVRPQDEVILRLAGLLHDVGHGFFSHVSERVMSRFASIDGLGSISAFRIEAQNYFGTTSVPAVAEILSSLMVLLPEFEDVLELAQAPMWQDAPGELARRIAQLIAGGRSPTRPFLTEIISGALDADKLDYMPRDCYMAGLPMPVDVDRLLEKIQVVSVRADRLPPGYAERYGLGCADNVEILAVQTGGARAFEELVVSRVLLYDKLYNHQKIRALEGMVENALDLLGSSTTAFRHFSTFLRMTDANFMSGQWPDEKSDADRYRQAQEIVGRISRRQAYVRVFAFGPGLISSPDPRDPANDAMIRRSWATLRPLVSRNRNTEALEFRREVVQLAREYLIAIGQSGLAGELAEHHMVIDLPDVQGIAEKTRFYVGDEDYGVELYNRRFRVERWAEAYENQKIVGYVFCPAEVTVAVHLAVRQLFKKSAGLCFENQSWAMTKLAPSEIAKTCDLLRSRGQDLDPFAVPPELVSRQLYLQSISRKQELLTAYEAVIPELARRFQTFQPANGDPISDRHIREWLIQFDFDAIPLAVAALQHIRYWDRAALTDAFIALLENRPELHSTQWLSLGGPTTSARHLTYLWPDIRKKFDVSSPRMRILSEARDIKTDSSVVLYDDNVGSGGQGATVLQQWSGIPRDQWMVDEDHVEPLDGDSLARLKSCEVVFLFATGRRTGLERLIAKARELLGHDRVSGDIVAPDDVNCFRAASRVFTDSTSIARARTAFESAGRIALSDKLEKWDREKLESRILGYGNAGGLTVFYYNVPTTTVTALWKTNGQEWRSLFNRRPRD